MTLTRVDQVVSVRGLELHYRETRDTRETWDTRDTPDTRPGQGGAGIPVIALHGHPGTAATWDAVAGPICAPKNPEGSGDSANESPGASRFVALTQRGYGDSARSTSYEYDDFVADVFGFADVLGLDTFVLLGHSFGGTIASLAAELDSARLRGLVLEDSVLPRDPYPWRDPERPEGELAYDWDVVAAISSRLADPDPAWWTSLARIGCPTLVLGGGSTSHVPQDLLADAVELIPDARLVTIEDAGHTPHRTRPERFAREVRAFLGTLTSAG